MKQYWEIIKNYNKFHLFRLFLIEIHRKLWREMIMRSYAQNYEDLVMGKYFKAKKKGFYVEIGAYHPTQLSNTYYFYRNGWKGVVVEPNPEVKDIFQKVRPRDIFINSGVAKNNGFLNYFKFLIPAINTFSKKEALLNINSGHKLDKKIKIKIIGIEDLILSKKIKKIDLLSLDTEGFDELILKSWPWEKIKPRVICVEIDKKNQIESFLIKYKYQLIYRSKTNAILAHIC